MYVFTEKYGKLSLNYPCYPFLPSYMILLFVLILERGKLSYSQINTVVEFINNIVPDD